MPGQPRFCGIATSFLLLVAILIMLVNMWTDKMPRGMLDVILVAATVQQATAQCTTGNAGTVDLGWHAPNSTSINSLAAVVNGTGVNGFIFNNSVTPSTTSYSTYNWCNMPHIRSQEYVIPPKDFKLEYVEVIHRHHKRTPYASNAFPRETYAWYCDDEALFYYGTPRPDGTSADINWQVYTSDSNPFAPAGFNGTCQFPQITGQGLNDSRQHGKDLYGVYHSLLKFLPAQIDNAKVKYRVTNNVITSQVAGQIVEGMYPSLTNTPVGVAIQPASIDSLEPTYTCSAASALFSSYGVGSKVANWTLHLNQSQALFAKLDSVSGVNSSDSGWHSWFDHYFDNLSARLCHQKPLPCNASNSSLCITQADANAVFRRGEYEYSFIYRDSPSSLAASAASFGVWMAELASNMRAAMSKSDPTIYRHNVAHDGSVSRLLSILQIDVMVWPGMGSEVAFELYSNKGCWFVRILFGGQVLRSSNPSLGRVDLIPVQALLGYIDGLIGPKASKVPQLCAGS